MHTICENWKRLVDDIQVIAEKNGRNPNDITVVAVSKTHTTDAILQAAQCGVRTFGENYAQEFREKQRFFSENNDKNIEWHFIGHIQTNKIKYIAPHCTLIHTVDSPKLADELQKFAAKSFLSTHILIQVNTSGERSKSGVSPDEALVLASHCSALPNIVLDGLMCVPAPGSSAEVRKEFRRLYELRKEMKNTLGDTAPLKVLSMGMSDDYDVAIEEGATIVRIGSLIFGSRGKHATLRK